MEKIGYFFKSKVDEKWIKCDDEKSALRMHKNGYEVVKKVKKVTSDRKAPQFYLMTDYD